MVTPQLVQYIQQQLAAGVSTEKIQAALAGQGWVAQDIADGFSAAHPAPLVPPPPPQTKPETLTQLTQPPAQTPVQLSTRMPAKEEVAKTAAPKQSHWGLVGVLLGVVFVVLGVGGGAAYAYLHKLGPFAQTMQSPETQTSAIQPATQPETVANSQTTANTNSSQPIAPLASSAISVVSTQASSSSGAQTSTTTTTTMVSSVHVATTTATTSAQNFFVGH
ncbi:MAG: hypothetical protein WCI89_03260 [bacterium]